MKEKMRENNRGFSLVELIVVIAIMAILAGGTTVGFKIIRDNDIKKTSSKIEGILGNTKTYCLGKKSASCTFYKDGTDLKCRILVNNEIISDEVIGGSKLTIKYKVASAKGTYSVTDLDVKEIGAYGSGNDLTIAFDHSSGALKPYNDLVSPKTYVYELYLCKDSKVITYRFVPATGKFDVR